MWGRSLSYGSLRLAQARQLRCRVAGGHRVAQALPRREEKTRAEVQLLPRSARVQNGGKPRVGDVHSVQVLMARPGRA